MTGKRDGEPVVGAMRERTRRALVGRSKSPNGCLVKRLTVPWLALIAAFAPGAQAEGATPVAPTLDATDPWSFNLTLYAWLVGVNGNYRAGPRNKSVDANFIDIAEELSSFPLAFMGRFEAHYERFGFYLDGNYMDLDFENRTGPRGVASVGLSTQLGLMDYGFMYRIAGPSPADHANPDGKTQSNRLDLYVGGRTLWLTNTLDPKRLSERSASATLTSPMIGGRFGIDITPDWFLMVDGNLGGFGVDNVSFTGTLQGMVGYRTKVFEIPTSLEIGYRALRVTTQPSSRLQTNTTLNGPFAGLTAYW